MFRGQSLPVKIGKSDHRIIGASENQQQSPSTQRSRAATKFHRGDAETRRKTKLSLNSVPDFRMICGVETTSGREQERLPMKQLIAKFGTRSMECCRTLIGWCFRGNCGLCVAP